MHHEGFWTYFDFATFLVLCTVVTGAIWGLDAWVLAPKRRNKREALTGSAAAAGSSAETSVQVTVAAEGKQKDHDKEKQAQTLWEKTVELARSFFPVFLAVLVLRSFVVEPFKIPTGSMIPTLLVGDFILVNKASYGIHLPITNTKIIDVGDPERCQVVVFRYPSDPRINFIKRMIGLPGDTVEYRNKVLYINGKEMVLEITDKNTNQHTYQQTVNIYIEDLEGVKHTVQHLDGQPGRTFREVVPEGHYFVMGDNRDDSADSRAWGFVPAENLVGRAFLVWFNLNFDAPWGEKLKWKRIGGDIE